MKKSRIAKLALLGASTAALAATLTTSTYAWYVSNRQAEVTGGYGATGSAGSDGSILVSWDTTTRSWSRSINFKDAGATHNAASAALQPVHWAAAENSDAAGFYSLGVDTSNHQTIKGTAAGANDVLTFTVVLKSNQAANQKTLVTPSFKMVNYGANAVSSGTPAAPTAQQVLVGSYKLATSYAAGTNYYTRTGAGTTESPYVYNPAPVADATAFAAGTYYVAVQNGLPGKELNDSFVVNALKAMYIKQETDIANSTPTYINCDADSVMLNSFTDTEPTGANAHTYYTAVTGNTVAWGANPTAASANMNFYITGTAEVEVTYTVYLDGADVDCFNSCVGQNFSIDVTFSAGEPEAITQQP